MPDSSQPEDDASPCVGICRIDGTQVDGEAICVGCYRSLREIAEWTLVSDRQRIEFNRNAQQRRRSWGG